MNATATAESATDALTDADYAIAERVLDALCARVGRAHRDTGTRRTFTPSEIARFVKATTDDVRRVLAALVSDGNVRAEGNGAWTRYMFARG